MISNNVPYFVTRHGYLGNFASYYVSSLNGPRLLMFIFLFFEAKLQETPMEGAYQYPKRLETRVRVRNAVETPLAVPYHVFENGNAVRYV